MRDARPVTTDSFVGRAPGSDLLTLAVAVTAVSFSGPIVAATTAPVLAVAFWRNGLGAAVTAIATAVVRPRSLRIDRAETRLVLLAGCLLAAHFACWMPSLRLTSVASSVALVSTLPVWTAVIARVRGEVVPARAWWGIAVALAGVVALTGVDLSLDPRSLLGDLLALAGAVFAALYVVVGSHARQSLSTAVYTSYAYAVCAAILLAACLVGGVQLTGYSPRNWALIVALTILAQLLGHSLVNRALRRTSPTIVALAILFEMPGAAVIAAVWLGQVPSPAVVPAVLGILAGLVLTITARRPADEPAP